MWANAIWFGFQIYMSTFETAPFVTNAGIHKTDTKMALALYNKARYKLKGRSFQYID
jgi:hypothetical protein